ncbi:transglycosylase domain-containing protein [Methyloligella sp. 2.7D]|uniref:transglycosylase domain-containing protein n=1 Tax=unclassified Methyloligella TaxID=2625955 RepID=UPI00157C818D|nr:transglycosylase domain-containing protein [Methyloligella sp. GL2]QKP78519.1 transglycosylase domain-containing protein [Methyloligella sp. GL2]
MLRLVRWLLHILELAIALPLRAVRFLLTTVAFNPRLGRLRLIVGPLVLYLLFALTLTYVYAPIRGFAGQFWMAKALAYADERSLATAIYDSRNRFVGIFDPLLDSEADFNYTGRAIALPNYIAYPDHKSLHVAAVPEDYWSCLSYHEDRHLGGLANPFGIDLYGVLKIPVSTVTRSLRSGDISLGVGGSTLSMQLARIFFKSPPSPDESASEKLSRKFKEWWLAPVIQWQLTRGGDITPMKRWTADHFPLAQRTGGQELYGVAQTSLIVFGKPASELSTAEQYVLAAAVNRPIILLGGSEALEQLREQNWHKLTRGRAEVCANALIEDAGKRAAVIAELERLSQRPPDPHPLPWGEDLLAELSPALRDRAEANPVYRSNVLLPSVKYGVREELKSRFGFGWRSHVSAVHLSLDAAENFQFRDKEKAALAKLDARYRGRINPAYSLDFDTGAGAGKRHPDVIIAAADEQGRLVRYFESNYNAAYFGSAAARDKKTGRYDPEREARAIASVGKMIAGIAIANEGKDTAESQWLDTRAPETGLEACGHGDLRRLRTAEVCFACSLNTPLLWRTAQVPKSQLLDLTNELDITLTEPVTSAANLAKSIVVGHVAASPQVVHRMAGVVLAGLTGEGDKPLGLPVLTEKLDLLDDQAEVPPPLAPVVPNEIAKPASHAALRSFLTAPICYPHGTMRRLSDWCAEKRQDVALHFAKTGTRGTGALDPAADDTVDLWVAGGIQFETGAAYSYVVVVGTGSPSEPWARDLYAGQIAEPLLRVLLEDLEKRPPAPDAVTQAE